NPPTTLHADDGSGWAIAMDPANYSLLYATRKDGTVVNVKYNPNNQWPAPGTLIQDSNGNQIILPGDGSNATDTLGRPFSPSGLTYYDSTGTARTIQVTYTAVAIHTNMCQFAWDTCY